MTSFAKCTLALLLFGLAAGRLPAQAPPTPAADAKATEMTEDVEVLRLLLNKAFGFPRTGGGTALAFSPDGTILYSASHGGSSGPPSWTRALTASQPAPGLPELFDGVYLKGHGIAYTIRLSTLARAAVPTHEKTAGLAVTCQNCHSAEMVAKFNLTPADPTAPKPLTDWDKARNELRGVANPADATAKPNLAEMCAPGALTETVTKLLAANGRHLRHLSADESVSVVITYEGVTGPAHDRTTGTMADPALWNPKAGEEPYTKFGLTADESKQIVLGDLHLKQGKYADAAKAYEQGLARYAATTKVLARPKNTKPADVDAALKDLHASVTAAYRSLAQAYIGTGNLDEAKRALNLAQQMEIKLEGGDKKEKGTPVPAKIILTVKKAHLDAAEKLAPADFRKGVSVETVGLTATAKK